MRTGRFALAFVTLAALVFSGTAPVFCAPDGHGVMKCCKTAPRQGQGMKQTDCCRFVPTSPGHVPAGVENSSVSRVSRDEIRGTASAHTARAVSFEEEAHPQASPPPILRREPSIPLYILNTSLLR